MARNPSLAPASRIRIEDEVWEEAFSSRVPARGRSTRPRGAVTPVRASISPVRGAASPVPASVSPVRAAPASPEVTLRLVPEDGPRVAPQGERRTVRIQGRGADPYRSVSSGRARLPAAPRPSHTGPSPDRLAMWATLLGFLLVLVAVLSSHF